MESIEQIKELLFNKEKWTILIRKDYSIVVI